MKISKPPANHDSIDQVYLLGSKVVGGLLAADRNKWRE
jgi:hypothetical protein